MMQYSIKMPLGGCGLGVEIQSGSLRAEPLASYDPGAEIFWGFIGLSGEQHRHLITAEYERLYEKVQLTDPDRQEETEFGRHFRDVFGHEYGDWILTHLRIYPDSIMLGYSSENAKEPEFIKLEKVKFKLEFDVPVSLDRADGIELIRVWSKFEVITETWSCFIWRQSMPDLTMEIQYAVDDKATPLPRPTSRMGKWLQRTVYPQQLERSRLGNWLYRQLYPNQRPKRVPRGFEGLQIEAILHICSPIRRVEQQLPGEIILLDQLRAAQENAPEEDIAEWQRALN